MKKSLLLLLFPFSVPMLANEGYDAFSVRSGFLVPETSHILFSYERTLSIDNSYSYFGELGAKSITTSHPEDYYWDLGMMYHHNLVRFKNGELKLTSEVHSGASEKQFFLGAGIGFEYNYTFRNGVVFVLHQTNQVNFFHNDTFKNGLLVGLKFPF